MTFTIVSAKYIYVDEQENCDICVELLLSDLECGIFKDGTQNKCYATYHRDIIFKNAILIYSDTTYDKFKKYDDWHICHFDISKYIDTPLAQFYVNTLFKYKQRYTIREITTATMYFVDNKNDGHYVAIPTNKYIRGIHNLDNFLSPMSNINQLRNIATCATI